jgi:hypothetical protein
MAEHTEEEGFEGTERPEQPNPTAVAIALGRVPPGAGADATEATAFLRDQRRLINLQAEHLHEQRELVLTHLKVRRWKDRLSLALQTLGIGVGAAVVLILIVAAWRAHEDRSLIINAFSVPPELARDGLTGEVVAARFLDRLQALQTATESDRPANTFENNWGEQIKLEIPETGLRWGDVEKLLREKLGHVSYVTGEVYKTATGIALTAREGDVSPQTFVGSQEDLDLLEQRAAEAVYRITQPYRFSDYLEQHGRVTDAFNVIADLATNGPPSERPWAYSKWAQFDLMDHADADAARLHARLGFGLSTAADVDADIALIAAEVWSGHEELALQLSKDLDPKAHRQSAETTAAFFESNSHVSAAWLASLRGDLKASAAEWLLVSKARDYIGLARLARALAATDYTLDHDPLAAREALAPLQPTDDLSFLQTDAVAAFTGLPAFWEAAERGDWTTALADARAADAWLEEHKTRLKVATLMQRVWMRPLAALAQAKSGDFAGAEALIATTPEDCYLCVRVRGQIAAAKHDWAVAERWFGEAAAQSPSLPFAYTEWGAERLSKGDPDGAIVEFARAHQAGPHFADPLEQWGEALLRKGNFRGATDKFREADREAPRWGRNHLRWGEALLRAGRVKDARMQFGTVNALALDAQDRAALATLVAAPAR